VDSEHNYGLRETMREKWLQKMKLSHSRRIHLWRINKFGWLIVSLLQSLPNIKSGVSRRGLGVERLFSDNADGVHYQFQRLVWSAPEVKAFYILHQFALIKNQE